MLCYTLYYIKIACATCFTAASAARPRRTPPVATPGRTTSTTSFLWTPGRTAKNCKSTHCAPEILPARIQQRMKFPRCEKTPECYFYAWSPLDHEQGPLNCYLFRYCSKKVPLPVFCHSSKCLETTTQELPRCVTERTAGTGGGRDPSRISHGR